MGVKIMTNTTTFNLPVDDVRGPPGHPTTPFYPPLLYKGISYDYDTQ